MRALLVVVAAVGSSLGVFYPFISVILDERGFDPAEIGVVTAVAAIGFTVAVPAWGHVADVKLGRRRTLQLCALAAALSVGVLLAPVPPILVAVAILGYFVFESAFQSLADALSVNAIEDPGRDYGRIRLISSATFAVGTIAAGVVYDMAGYGPAPLLFGALALTMAIAVERVPDVGRAQLAASAGAAGRFGSMGEALRVAPRLVLILLAVGLLHIGIVGGFTFLGLRLVALGGSASDVALSFGLAALFEIPAMIVASRLAGRVGPRVVFALSAGLYALCLAGWVVFDTPALIIATRAVSGVAFAGVVVSVVLTIASLLPAELQATGQGLFQTVGFGLGAIVANFGGGLLYDSFGHAAVFGAGAALATLAVVVGWLYFPQRLVPSADLAQRAAAASMVEGQGP